MLELSPASLESTEGALVPPNAQDGDTRHALSKNPKRF